MSRHASRSHRTPAVMNLTALPARPSSASFAAHSRRWPAASIMSRSSRIPTAITPAPSWPPRERRTGGCHHESRSRVQPPADRFRLRRIGVHEDVTQSVPPSPFTSLVKRVPRDESGILNDDSGTLRGVRRDVDRAQPARPLSVGAGCVSMLPRRPERQESSGPRRRFVVLIPAHNEEAGARCDTAKSRSRRLSSPSSTSPSSRIVATMGRRRWLPSAA
jgi:hypothetical protein